MAQESVFNTPTKEYPSVCDALIQELAIEICYEESWDPVAIRNAHAKASLIFDRNGIAGVLDETARLREMRKDS